MNSILIWLWSNSRAWLCFISNGDDSSKKLNSIILIDLMLGWEGVFYSDRILKCLIWTVLIGIKLNLIWWRIQSRIQCWMNLNFTCQLAFQRDHDCDHQGDHDCDQNWSPRANFMRSVIISYGSIIMEFNFERFVIHLNSISLLPTTPGLIKKKLVTGWSEIGPMLNVIALNIQYTTYFDRYETSFISFCCFYNW